MCYMIFFLVLVSKPHAPENSSLTKKEWLNFFFLNNGVIHLVGKYLSTYYVFSSILGPENTVVNKADKLSWWLHSKKQK